MNENLKQDIKKHFEEKSTEELLTIWQENERGTYSKNSFEAVQAILNEREVEIPPQPDFVPKPQSEPEWDLKKTKKNRKLYLAFFLLTIAASIATALEELIVFLYIFFLVLFLCYFLSTAKRVRGYSFGTVFVMCIGLFVPLVSLVILVTVDKSIYETIRKREHPELIGEIKPRLSFLAVLSLITVLLPLIGLPLAVAAIWRISKSNGQIYGKFLAWTSLVLNTLLLSLFLLGFIINLLRNPV